MIKSPVTYSQYIVPACIPTNSSSIAGMTSIATGWGTTSFGGSTSRFLMQVAMPILTDASCQQKYPEISDVSTGFCAGETGGNKDTCQVN